MLMRFGWFVCIVSSCLSFFNAFSSQVFPDIFRALLNQFINMAVAVSLNDVLDAVASLPVGQDPCGQGCKLSRAMQCIFFPYRLRQAEADLFIKEGFTSVMMLNEADPDGSADQRQLYINALEKLIDGLLWRRLARKAVRHLFSGKAFVKITDDACSSSNEEDPDL